MQHIECVVQCADVSNRKHHLKQNNLTLCIVTLLHYVMSRSLTIVYITIFVKIMKEDLLISTDKIVLLVKIFVFLS